MSVTVKSVEVRWFKMQLFENKLAELEDICCMKRIFVTFIIYAGGTVRAKKLDTLSVHLTVASKSGPYGTEGSK